MMYVFLVFSHVPFPGKRFPRGDLGSMHTTRTALTLFYPIDDFDVELFCSKRPTMR